MKAQIKGFIAYQSPYYAGHEGELRFVGCDMSDHGYTMLQPHMIEVDLPDFDPREAQVSALKAAKQKAMADFQALVTKIDRQISELTALEYTA